MRVDSHRRVPPTALEDLLRMVGWKFTREQVRSLWLHRALLSALMADPQRARRPSARHDQRAEHSSTGGLADRQEDDGVFDGLE